MTSATKRLMGLVGAGDCFDTAPADLLPEQLEAANERLGSQIVEIGLLANRAAYADVTEIKEPADLVPLLFAHTTYKTYAEGWLAERRWDRTGKWLATVSTRPVEGLDTDGVETLDDWIKRLESIGHYLSCSSGTAGKPAMLSCTEGDITFSAQTNIAGLLWATGLRYGEDRKFLGLGPQFAAPREDAIRQAMIDVFSPRYEPYQFGGGEPITVGSMVDMITLRRKLADGTPPPRSRNSSALRDSGRRTWRPTRPKRSMLSSKPARCQCWPPACSPRCIKSPRAFARRDTAATTSTRTTR